MSHCIIIDGHAVLHRAYHALPPLRNKEGKLTNAVYGFLLVFFKVLKEYEPGYIAVCFDVSRTTFRSKLYDQYKAHRSETPDDLRDQIPMLKNVLRAFGVAVYEKDGYEADDLIGTLATQVTQGNNDTTVVIVTGDKDTLQLVSDRVVVYALQKGVSDTFVYTPGSVKEKLGILPGEVIEYKALRGDASDNIPGVAGIGEKSATDLIQKFHSLEAVYTEIDSSDIPSRIRDKLIAGKESAFLSRKLATIDCAVPIRLDMAALQWKGADYTSAAEALLSLGFRSLVGRIPPSQVQGELFGPAQSQKKKKALEIRIDSVSEKTITESLRRSAKQKMVFFHSGTDGAFFLGDGSEAWLYVPAVDAHRVLKKFAACLADAKVTKVGFDLKPAMKQCGKIVYEFVPPYWDLRVIAYLLEPDARDYSVRQCALRYLQRATDALSANSSDPESELQFIPAVATALIRELKARGQWKLYEEIEMPLIPILADMERSGVACDIPYFKKLHVSAARMVASLERKVIRAAGGEEFNLNSPKQLQEVLFEKLKLTVPGMRKTKNGSYSTNADILEKLKDQHPIIPLILEYREYHKLLTTYIEALPKLIGPDGRIHTTFDQTVAATGRLSSRDPNLQNIPIRTELGRQIRKAFIAPRGMVLMSADYSQIDLRVIAALSSDSVMIKAFLQHQDIHTQTASFLFAIPPEQVTQEQRRHAKAINFGIIYGLGPHGLAMGTGMKLQEAKAYIERYFTVHAGIRKYIDRTLAQARKTGYVETFFGRRRYMPELNSENQFLRAQAERVAVNHPVQGTATGDIMKVAMIRVYAALEKQKLGRVARCILQVHDELVFEVDKKAVRQVKEVIVREMTHAVKLPVPLEVEVHEGRNWEESHA